MISLGNKVRDRISGFIGIVTGRTEYLYKSVRVEVSAQELSGGVPIEGKWFDEAQLEVFDADKVGLGFKGNNGTEFIVAK